MRRRRPERARLYRSPAYRELADRLAANVRRWRMARGWTQEEAAFRCELGVRQFQGIEAAETNLTLVTLGRLAMGFDIDGAQLFRPSPPRRRG